MTGPTRLDRLGFGYPTGDRPALDALTLEFAAGEVTWLLGALGAGCSTLLQVLAGIAPRVTGGTRTGDVLTLGQDPATDAGRLALAGRVGYVTASPHLQLSGVASSVEEEVAFGPANLGWPRERIREAVGRALGAMEIPHLAGRAPGELSGGEVQRVVLASMLVLDPAIWLLDDPAAPLDVAGRAVVGRLFRSEAARGATLIVASEDADLLAPVSDRLLVLRQGRVVLDGPPAALLQGEEVWDAGAGSTSIAALAREVRTLAPDLAAPPYPLTVETGVSRWR